MKKLDKYANALATLTKFISDRFVNAIIARPETENKEPYRFFYTILLKSNSALDTCSLLLANYYDRPHHADSLAIVLRSMITDCVIYQFLLEKSRGDTDTELLTNISSIYFDHVDFTVKGLQGYFKDIYDWTDQEIAEEITKIKRARPNYYDADEKIKIATFPNSVRYILREMARNRVSGDKADLRNLYHHYDILSKYEHLGELSFELIHRQYSESSRHKFLDEIVDVINRSIIPVIISCVGVWPDLSETNMLEFKKLFKDVLEAYRPSYIDEVAE